MARPLRSCLGRLVTVLVLVGVAYAGWRWGSAVFTPLEEALGVDEPSEVVQEPAPTAELAEATLARIERFRAGEGEPELRLTALEVSSLLRFALPGMVPGGVSDPSVAMSDDGLELRANVAVEAFPDMPPLDEVLALLPDTVQIRLRGEVAAVDGSRATLYVRNVFAGPIPLPDRFVPEILTALGRRDEEGLPASAMLFRLPRGVRSVFVRGDRLILAADR